MRAEKDKRWNEREQRWVRPEGGVFDPSRFSADVIKREVAKEFVVRHHYSGTCCSQRFCVGLFGPNARLVGVAVFGQPMKDAVLHNWLGAGSDVGCELGRFVLLDEVKFNGESWFVSRAFALLRSGKGLTRVLSCADPVARYHEGNLVKSAHWGQIYKATNGRYAGRTEGRNHVCSPADGRVVSPRALAKIRRHDNPERNARGEWKDRGWEYAVRQLESMGAPPRAFGESWTAWVKRATAPFPRLRHDGNLAYVFGLDKFSKKALATLHGSGLPYPKPTN